jgi:hypothetical protein
MSTAENGHRPDEGPGRRTPARVDSSARVPARVNSSTRVNVALPFSQFKIQEPSDHLLALTVLVEDLAGLVAKKVPGPEAEDLCRRAHELASRAH